MALPKLRLKKRQRAEAGFGGDLGERFVGVDQQSLGVLKPYREQIVEDGLAGDFAKDAREVFLAHFGVPGDFAEG